MDSNGWVSIISLLGTAIGTFGGIIAANKLSNYRIEQLEKQVEKHNSIVERTYELEKDVSLAFERIKDGETQIDRLRRDVDKLADKS